MSTAEAAHRAVKSRRAAKLWLALLAVITAGIGLAWVGAQSVNSRVVQVDTLKAGSGPFVQAPDGVLIDYEGRLEDGTVFDSSAGKGPVPLLASQVIPGFTQGLLKMQKGGRYKLRIPSDLAYGASPPQGSPIPPNANLEFDVNVVQVVPNAALMQGGAPPGQ
jgi:FKBP-type peptidyl-prolyl cis-trans isomerase FkpA